MIVQSEWTQLPLFLSHILVSMRHLFLALAVLTFVHDGVGENLESIYIMFASNVEKEFLLIILSH